MRFDVLAFTAAIALFPPPAAGATLERIVAVVDGRPILLSDVRAVEALDGVDRSAALARLVDETLLFHEAVRLPRAALTPEEAQAAAGGASGPTAAGPRRRAALRRAVIRKYTVFRFRPQVRIEEERVRRAWADQWAGRSDAPSFESVSASLRERLAEEGLAALVMDWVRDLRSSANIRYNTPD